MSALVRGGGSPCPLFVPGPRGRTLRSTPTFAIIVLCLLTGFGCHRTNQPAARVVLYSSVDEPYLRPVLERFRRDTGIEVTLVPDTEATKTAGLAEKVLAEKDHPAADVYWGNEPFHTIRLAEAGALASYRPPGVGQVAARFGEKEGMFTPVGLRARMLAVSSRAEFRGPTSKIKALKDLADPALKGKIGISHPGFGTASGHVAALYIAWGDAATDAWLRSLADNGVLLLGGNSVVADQVAAGTLVAGLTDNDDVANAKAEGQPIEGVIPEEGTLLIPTTVALVKGGPHPAGAKRLIDFLTSADVEKELIDRHFLAYSVRDEGGLPKHLEVDLVQVAHRMPEAVARSLKILQGR
jgi:iron(III) transport system substrate-binding protein